jgi:hypothetical protein
MDRGRTTSPVIDILELHTRVLRRLASRQLYDHACNAAVILIRRSRSPT